ncbi:MAG: hypothetical protein QM488_11680 [Rhizobiaceae bacterium]
MTDNQPLSTTDLSVEKLIIDYLNTARVNRYALAARGGGVTPTSLYLWNCDLSAAFYMPLHFAEITCRNTIHKALCFRDVEWPKNPTFRGILGGNYLNDLDSVIAEEGRQHGDDMTNDHIVSALSFGFWEHLTTKRFGRFLWSKGFQRSFGSAPWKMKLHDLQRQIESVRRWRNRIAHHNAIFDKKPSSKLQDAITLIEWSSPELSKWVAAQCQVQSIINDRPKGH